MMHRHRNPGPSVMEVFGRGKIVDFANGRARNLNVPGLDAMDLRTCNEKGATWDFSKTSNRKMALNLVRVRRPMWLIGSPPCAPFFSVHGTSAFNASRMDPEER